ncbi:MAG: SpoIIE family protein phosphatase [Flavobacteriales bacterium]|jgi:ligand-binding sensor domain-containing protein/serine phosphatase RsbU (regulator of sigma subunit)|nr:SpoIIE family protein phosphatase [Flavobacteriales bacterium]
MKLKYCCPLLLLISCAKTNKTVPEPASLYAVPKVIKLNTEEGYSVNPVTGDSIIPIINSYGDTVKTGSPFLVKEKATVIEEVRYPKVASVEATGSYKPKLQLNRCKISPKERVEKVQSNELKVIPLKKTVVDDTTHYIINTLGNKIKTGVPLSLKGKVVLATKTKPAKASPLVFKDAANVNMQYLDVDQGLPSSYISCSYQDKQGYIWFGTYGGGAVRYDGNSFTHFTIQEGLNSNVIRAILEDKKGNLWLGTDGGGIVKFDGNSFTCFTERNGLTSNRITTILESKEQDLWFGTDGGGVIKYDGNSFTCFTENEGLTGNKISAIEESRDGKIWLGVYGGGIVKFDGKAFVHFSPKGGSYNDKVLSMIEDQQGNLWFGTYDGVVKYDGEHFTFFLENSGVVSRVLTMLEDKSGNIWIGTDGGGVVKYDGSQFTCYTEKDGLSSNAVTSIMEDKSGNLWIGTYGGGVVRYKESSFIGLTQKEGLSSNKVSAIMEDKSGNLWLGTDGGGVMKYDGECVSYFTKKDGISSNVISSIIEDEKGVLWFGTHDGGVTKYNGTNFIHLIPQKELGANSVLSMIQDRKGNLWFGTHGGGIVKYNGEKAVCFTEKEGASSNSIVSIMEDRDGNIWFGSYRGGVTKYDGRSFTHFTEKEGLSNNTVWCIMQDHSGSLWFGTDGGAIKYNGSNFQCFSKEEGLSNNVVWSIAEDDQKRIWISTERGLNELISLPKEASEKEERVKIHQYAKSDGLKGIDFFANSVCIDSKNRAWWGSGKGLVKLNLNEHKLVIEPPMLYLQQIEVDEHFVNYDNIHRGVLEGAVFDSLSQQERIPFNLKLPYDKNHITIYFVGVDWNASHKLKYSYRLKGMDHNWSIPTKETKVDYRNLSYGEYTFEVKAIGGSQQWSQSVSYRFVIRPPWWNTWWARVLYTVFVLVLVFSIVKLRTNKLKKRKAELEHEIGTATEEIRAQKEEVERAHKEITDSINYAERIQRSFLASEEVLNKNLEDYFIYFQPKEAVSGDFYWARELKCGCFAVLNADSTGHGVPGAIMSIINIFSIEQAIEKGITKPAEVFNDTRKTIIDHLKKDGSPDGGQDGMDAALMIFNVERTKLYYATAQNPIWIVRKGELIEITPEKMPVGKHHNDHIPFVGGEFELNKGDVVYTLTDGFQDLFGGPKGGKFKIRPLKKMVLEIADLPLSMQREVFVDTFNRWKGELEQVDDICIIGIKV